MMKTTTNAESLNVSSSTAVPPATRRMPGLQLVLAVLLVVAAWFVYRDVTETVALHQILDEVRASYNVVGARPAAASPVVNLFETKPAVAGL